MSQWQILKDTAWEWHVWCGTPLGGSWALLGKGILLIFFVYLRCYYLQSLGFMKGFLSLHLVQDPVGNGVCWGNKIFVVLLGDFQLPEEQPTGCSCLLSECGMGGGWGQWCWGRGGLHWSWMVQRWSENPVPEAEMVAAAKGISVRYPHSGSEDDVCKRGCSSLFSLPSISVLKLYKVNQTFSARVWNHPVAVSDNCFFPFPFVWLSQAICAPH